MTDQRWIAFETVVLGTLTALAIWQVGIWAWSCRWVSLAVGAVLVAVVFVGSRVASGWFTVGGGWVSGRILMDEV